MKVPRCDFGRRLHNDNLALSTPIIGLGCSSFSTFFWTPQEEEAMTAFDAIWKPETLDQNHPRVQEWIRTIRVAIQEYGITLLDTAPWYGHGTSEVVIGWAMEDVLKETPRQEIVLNTKVGRYEAEPAMQFDFSRRMTLHSVQRSLERMNCRYIDVLQLHDPEFAPSLQQLLEETIPAMVECRKRGWCKALGMTGYPIETQHQILQQSMDVFGENVWDQALTYGHYNLHDTSLLHPPSKLSNQDDSFADYCERLSLGLLAAAPLSMGLLTHSQPPSWHPASAQLLAVGRAAASICERHKVDLPTIAVLFALCQRRIASTILGMKNVAELQRAAKLANRFHSVDWSLTPQEILQSVLTDAEWKAYQVLSGEQGPFASLQMSGSFQWDGVKAAKEFWDSIPGARIPDWHDSNSKK